MKGLLPNIKSELWPRMLPNDTYEQLCEHAYIAEAIVINKDLCEDKGITAVIAGMSHHEKQQDKEIEFLRNKLDRISNINDTPPKQESQIDDHTIAVADHYPPRRSFSGDRRPSRPDSRVQFQSTTPQRSNSFSHPQGTGNHFSRSRGNSLERFPPNRFNPSENRTFNGSQSPRPFNSSRPPFEGRAISPDRQQFSQNTFNRRPVNPLFSTPPIAYRTYNPSYSYNSEHNPPPPIRPYQNQNPRFTYNPNRENNPTPPPTRFTRSGTSYTPRFQQNGQRTITCYKCGYRGHVSRECRTPIYRPATPSFPSKRN